MRLSVIVLILGVTLYSEMSSVEGALPPHHLKAFEPIPEDLETAWTAFKKAFGLKFTAEEEALRKSRFTEQHTSVMKINLDPASTFKLGMWYPSAIETEEEKKKPMSSTWVTLLDASKSP